MSVEKFYKDPEDYLETAYNNVQKMPNNRIIKVGTNSLLVGTLAGLATVGLSVLTGSKKPVAVATGVSVGTLAAAASGMVNANKYGCVEQTKDKVRQFTKQI